MRPTETSRHNPDQNAPNDDEPFGPYEIGPQQKTLDFNPIEFSSTERARFLRQIDRWTIEEQMDEFQKLPCETLAEYMEARDLHLSQLEAFGPDFKREPKISEAWLMLNGQHPERGRVPPMVASINQLTLPFDTSASDEEAIPEELPSSTEETL